MKIVVVGTGYVGLVTGTCFAELGVNVVCVDIDQKKIDNLRNGIIPIFEPGLDELVTKNIKEGRLSFSTSLEDNIDGAEIIFSAVGTPPDEDGSADLQYVLDVARSVGRSATHYFMLVTKSTVPVGTAIKVKEAIELELKKRDVDINFDVASNPEFLKEGAAIEDFMAPDRVVIGVESEKGRQLMERLYKPFVVNGYPVMFMDIPSAEMTKYAANAMLATRISFMNEIANLCELTGANVDDVRIGIGSDDRIGSKFLNAGAGYGGSCFPKDVKALSKIGENYGYKMLIINSVEMVNEKQKKVIFNKLNAAFSGDLSGKTIAIWGLAYKPETDDMREAPSLVLINDLIAAGAKVRAFDPVAMDETRRRIGETITYCCDKSDAATGADAIAIVTEWKQFRLTDWRQIKSLMKGNIIVDGRNIYDEKELKERGFRYLRIGKCELR